ncbi:hypothetical protein GJ496_001917 [Pomphorhynchus laevis]|nr:hypothetical protein GJ496_001917 [Pomphorhynchus laevis]
MSYTGLKLSEDESEKIACGINRKLCRYLKQENETKVVEYLGKLKNLNFDPEVLKFAGIVETLNKISALNYGEIANELLLNENLNDEKCSNKRSLHSIPDDERFFNQISPLHKSNDQNKAQSEEVFFHCKRIRSSMYHGKRDVVTQIPTLQDLTINSLRENISKLEHLGNVAFDLLRPVLEFASVPQLEYLYDLNPQFADDFDSLWERHCKQTYKNAIPNDMESWYELFVRLRSEEENKLKMFQEKVSSKYSLSSQGRVTKPFIPIDNPTNTRQLSEKRIVFASVKPGAHPAVSKVYNNTAQTTNRPVTSVKPRIAPIMAKTLKMFKRQRR